MDNQKMTGLMSGKRGLVMGVANDHSIAWGIAQALHAQGAQLAFTYQGEAFGKRVQPLAASVGSDILIPCDVEDIATVDAVFNTLKEKWGTIDFVVHAIAFSDKNELKGKFADTSRENFVKTMVISAFSFVEITKRAAALMPKGGSIITLTYGWRWHWRCARHVQVPGRARALAPDHYAGRSGRRWSLSAVSTLGRCDGRNPLCGFRLQHHFNAAARRLGKGLISVSFTLFPLELTA
jgi:hypothetical protein